MESVFYSVMLLINVLKKRIHENLTFHILSYLLMMSQVYIYFATKELFLICGYKDPIVAGVISGFKNK